MISPQNELLLFLRMLRPAKTQHQKIRIGALGDGGYVLPNDLAGIQGVISIGIGDEVSFDSFFFRNGRSSLSI